MYISEIITKLRVNNVNEFVGHAFLVTVGKKKLSFLCSGVFAEDEVVVLAFPVVRISCSRVTRQTESGCASGDCGYYVITDSIQWDGKKWEVRFMYEDPPRPSRFGLEEAIVSVLS